MDHPEIVQTPIQPTRPTAPQLQLGWWLEPHRFWPGMLALTSLPALGLGLAALLWPPLMVGEARVLVALQETFGGPGVLQTGATWLAWLSATPLLAAGCALTVLVTLWLSGRRPALWSLGTLLLAGAVTLIAKRSFARPRPALWDPIVVERSFSFPAGTTLMLTALLCVILMLIWHQPARRWLVPLAIGLTVGTACARLLLGVHWPSDVLGGVLAGLACVAGMQWRHPLRPG